ncbi:MAG: anaerobic ribonucleoside-triphosphate reductase activating protein [Ruminococcaceae bacterium]|nr:anaerobic ribonucleoside-triphosphate reductase activating protein [Oscillospiraceae bacterium]
MRIAGLVQDSIVDGRGMRFVVFTQGCPHHCEGCHNPETHDPSGGKELTVDAVIKEMLSNPMTDGVTLSGGEPFMQPQDCAEIAKAAHNAGLNVWAYTGYTFEKLLESENEAVRELLNEVDVLIDGPFVLKERSLSIPWRGSKNQRMIDVAQSLIEGRVVQLD